MLFQLSALEGTLINIVAWLIIHLGVAYICNMIPSWWLKEEREWFEEKSWENVFYKRIMIKRWKDLAPDGSAIFTESFPKRNLSSKSFFYLHQFILETKRGEVAHILSIFPAILFFLWNPPTVGMIMVMYGLLANLPFLFIQRFNRFRLLRILGKAKKMTIQSPSSQYSSSSSKEC
ncbi:glycosyl-4,4'-diaponeurosporenoate acyltransferase [Bacillus tianshenii]|uniref:glycosyl-4,4'-diaponeurosporenoate acyltransferase CrtO family protein n=1 Tax=Sutcliffiella tianshenii TaxID=1463404 RepID=UPI001CD4C320|nr:glycosyl-4,4'-diaponeurosporenoate acyltransferase [Bacillus tianshenii]MCA1320837.1 glycosyl-4,4'-diaponeurosporenoate acyltransferase [Bacillus tianshenii]